MIPLFIGRIVLEEMQSLTEALVEVYRLSFSVGNLIWYKLTYK